MDGRDGDTEGWPRMAAALFGQEGLDLLDCAVEGAGMLELEGGDGSGETAGFGDGCSLGATIDIGHRVGVATTGGIDELAGREGIDAGGGILLAAIDERAKIAEREEYFAYAPLTKLVDSLDGIVFAREDIHLVFVGLQNIDILEGFLLLGPIGGANLFAHHFAQVTLHIDNNLANLVEAMDDIKGEIVGQKGTQDEIGTFDALQEGFETVPSERSGLAQHALLAVVHVSTVLVFEIDCRLAGKNLNTNTCFAQLLDSGHVLLSYCRDEPIGGTFVRIGVSKSLHTPGKIPCSATWNMQVDIWSHDMIMGNMSDANNFAHKAVEINF